METPQNNTVEAITFDGKAGQAYKIFLLNLFLGIITLGIYHFWGKTRMRRYITSSFSLLGDRFEYTGYGSELLWGFIKALIIVGVLSVPLFWSIYHYAPQIEQISEKMENFAKEREADLKKQVRTAGSESADAQKTPGSEKTKIVIKEKDNPLSVLTIEEKRVYVLLILMITFYWFVYALYLPFVAVFSALKYRVTRTHWRGIRGHMIGSSIVYGLVGVFHLLLKIITLGLWIPFGDAIVWKYKMNRVSFGNQMATFNPCYGRLLASHIGTILFTLLVTALAVVGTFAYIYLVVQGNVFPYTINELYAAVNKIAQDPQMNKNLALLFTVFFVTLFVVGVLSRFWYRATLIRAKYNGLRLGQIGFICRITGWPLFKQQFGNFLILVFTLGLGYPIVKLRRQRFFSRYTRVKGAQSATVLQATGERDKWGEGLGSMFDVEVGLF